MTLGRKQNPRVRQGKKLSISLTVKPLHGIATAKSFENQASPPGVEAILAGLWARKISQP
jgi:hypothetical protein